MVHVSDLVALRWGNLRGQGARSVDGRGPAGGRAGPGPVLVHVVRPPGPVAVAPVPGRSARAAQHVSHGQLLRDYVLGHIAAVHPRPPVRHQPGRYRRPVPDKRLKLVGAGVRRGVQLADRLAACLRVRGRRGSFNPKRVGDVRLLSGDRVCRALRAISQFDRRVRGARTPPPPVAVTAGARPHPVPRFVYHAIIKHRYRVTNTTPQR